MEDKGRDVVLDEACDLSRGEKLEISRRGIIRICHPSATKNTQTAQNSRRKYGL